MTEHHQPEEEDLDQVTDDIEELEKLEEEVKLMAQKIVEFRETLPAQLQNTLSLVLSAQIPVNLRQSDTDPGSSSNANPESVALVEDDVAHTEKLQTIKQKIASNNSAMSSAVKRMKECMSRIEKLESFNNGSYPGFKRIKNTSQE